jgi:hypothetical protein
MENIHASAREWLWKNHGFNGIILGAVTMALFIKIAGRKRESHPILPFSMTSSNTSTQQNTG